MAVFRLPGTVTWGCDVSSENGPIDYAKAVQPGAASTYVMTDSGPVKVMGTIEFVYLRCAVARAHGAFFEDPMFRTHLLGFQSAGVKRIGVYLFAHCSLGACEQAYELAKFARLTTMPPWNDWEVTDGMSEED